MARLIPSAIGGDGDKRTAERLGRQQPVCPPR